jgi:hypothetical protein
MAQAKVAPKFGSAEWRKLHPAKPKAPAPEFVTVEQFKGLESIMENMVSSMERFMAQPPVAAPVAPATPMDKEVAKAGPNDAEYNKVWDEHAKEIIGEAVDHTEVAYLKDGGVMFTIVIKKEMSNAPKDYLERMGADRRTKEVGSEGIQGVDNWCKLVKSNLLRPQ